MKHARLVNLLTWLWVLLFALVYPRAVRAATFAQDMGAYDYRSLAWAAGIALFGGGLRTIMTLATDGRVVFDVLRESWKDAVVSLIAGAVMFVLLEALRSNQMLILTSEWRFAVIAAAGWARISFFGLLARVGEKVADAAADWAINAARRIAGAPPALPPVEPPKDTP